jgi:predicted CXXCH cytochrome family protein
MNPETGIAFRVPTGGDEAEIERCSGCHSRRSLIREEFGAGRFLDRHMPALLDEGLYFADGQIQDEVYVFGSFTQSKMYKAGVRCGDCHDAHSLQLKAEGDALCAQCHLPAVFAARSHHQHPEDSAGARCVECHMPARTYMVVDDRRDHSFRIPRPDQSLENGSPNSCNGCHSDRDASWAATQIASWPGGAKAQPKHYGEALEAGRRRAADGQAQLMELVANTEAPAIVRATAVSLLERYPDRTLLDAIRAAAGSDEPLIRLAATRSADVLPIEERVRLVGRLLTDSVRAVRVEAARTLAGADPRQLGGHLTRARDQALVEYRHSQQLDADRPTAHVNLALLALSMGDVATAEDEYLKALEAGSYFLPAYVNYADLLRGLGREGEGEQLLLRGLQVEPDSADLHHSLGLLRVRLGRTDEAIDSLRYATELSPEHPRYAYVYGVALYSGGEVEEALAVLRAAHDRHPTELGLLEGLVSISREAGHLAEADRYLTRLQALMPAPESPGQPMPGNPGGAAR